MTDIKQRIHNDMKQAMLDKEKLKLTTIRMLMAQIKQVEIDSKNTLDDNKVLQIIQKMIKQRKDSLSQFESAGRQELADKENLEIECLTQYLPKQLSVAEIKTYVLEAITHTNASSMKDMGKLMAYLKPILQGKADMSQVSKCIKENLN